MERPRRRLPLEPIAVGLVFACLLAALAAVVAAHRRPSPRRATAESTIAVVIPPPPTPTSGPAKPAAVVEPSPPAPEDPTPRAVAALAATEADRRAEVEAVRKKIDAVARAVEAADAESERWRRSLALARSQIGQRVDEAKRRESQASLAAMERDALGRRRDVLKRAAEKDAGRPAFAVLPHRGLNGTWQRPIVIECVGGGVSLRPTGPTFRLVELMATLSLSGGPLVASVARQAVKIQRQAGPDGGEVVPYIFFIVRPDGIRPFYEARARLERLGVAFGYELADADWAIDFPDLDQIATWDGSAPPVDVDAEIAREAPQAQHPARAGLSSSDDGPDNPFVWPKTVGELMAGDGRSGQGSTPSGHPNDSGTGGRHESPGSGRLDGGRFGAIGDRPGPGLGLDGPVRGGGLTAGSGSGMTQPDSAGGRSDAQKFGDADLRATRDAWDRALKLDDPSRPVGLAPLTEADLAGGDPSGSLADPSGPRVGRDEPLAEANVGLGRRSTAHPDPVGRGTGRAGRGASGPPGSIGPGAEGVTLPALADRRDGRGAGRENGPGSAGGTDPGSGPGGPGGERGGSQEGGFPGGPSARPIELVLSCGPKGVVINPGDYRLTLATLRSKDAMLVAQVRAIVRRQREAAPGSILQPSIRYMIEPGGSETYAAARSQLGIEGVAWPSSVQVSGGDTLRLFSNDDW